MGNVEKSRVQENVQEKQDATKEEKEKNEINEIVKEFKKLCVDYHDRGSSDWNMRSYQKDVVLYKRFLKIDFKKLPEDLKPVYRHRLAYVQAIAKLGKNEKIRAFAIKFMGISADDLGGKFDLLYAKVKDSNEFKALSPADFKDAMEALEESLSILSKIPSGSAWKAGATEILKPDNVDDDVAAGRLKDGFTLIHGNIKKLADAKARQK